MINITAQKHMGTIRGKFRVILVCIVRLENRIYAVDLRNRLLSDVIMESLLKKRLPWFSQQKNGRALVA